MQKIVVQLAEVRAQQSWLPKPSPRGAPQTVDEARLEKAKRIVLTMLDTFNEQEFRELCDAIGMDYEDIPGNGRRQKIGEFVKRFYRHHTLDVLIEWLVALRPLADWPTHTPILEPPTPAPVAPM